MLEGMTADKVGVMRTAKLAGVGRAAEAFPVIWRMGAVMAAACLALLPAWADDAVPVAGEAGEISESDSLAAEGVGAVELTYYEVKSSVDETTEKGAKKAVYFNKQVYTVSRYSDSWWGYGGKGDMIGCMRYGTDSAGHLNNPTRMRWVAKSSETGDANLSGQDVTACVYNGRIYVVYDYINPNNWSERLLYFKSSSDPESLEWEPKGGSRIEAAAAVNTGFGPGSPRLNVAAAVLGDKLYVFYTYLNNTSQWVRSVVFDGKTWSAGPVLNDWRFGALDAQTVTAADGNELIAIVGVGAYYCYVMGFDGQTIRPSTNYLDFYGKGLVRDYVRIAGGSVANGTQASRLQIFASGGYGVWRYEYSLPDKYDNSGACSAGSLAGIKFTNAWGWCAATHFLNKGSDLKDLQQYLTLVGPMTFRAAEYSYTKLCAVTYASDYFKHLQTNQINTAVPGNLPSAWSIIGVIEGVPPFCLNGTKPEPQATSSVKYGQSVDKEVSTSQSYEASFSVGIGGEGKIIGGGVEYTQGFKNVHDWSTTIKKELTIEMENKDDNEDGAFGYLIVSKPNLTVSNYERRASDQSTNLGNVNFTFVADVSVEPVPYHLENPAQDGFAGITAKPKSADYNKWFCMPVPANLVMEKMNSLSADIRGTKSESTISMTSAEKVVRKSSSEVKVEAKFFEIFKTSTEFKFTLGSVNSTSLSKNISASLSLPKAATGSSALKRIVATPYWLTPDDTSATKPFWIPDGYLWNKPWCLTWSVTSLDPTPAPPKALTMDFNKDGIQDLAAFRVARSSAAAGKDDGNADMIGILYNITQGAKKRTAEKITLQSSNPAMKLLCAGDLDVNGCSDLLWLDTQRNALVAVLLQEDGATITKELQGIVVDDNVRPVEMGRFFTASEQAGILTRDGSTGELQLYQLDPTTLDVTNSYKVYNPGYSHWRYAGRGDFDGDNNWDLLVVNDETGEFNMVFLQADEGAGVVGRIATVQDELIIGNSVRALADLQYLGVCDFNGDGRSDMLFIENGKKIIVALMDAEFVSKSGYIKGAALKSGQTIVTVGDTSQDGRADIIIEHSSGKNRKLIIWSLGEPKKTSGKSVDALVVTATESLTLDKEFHEDLSIQLFPSLD